MLMERKKGNDDPPVPGPLPPKIFHRPSFQTLSSPILFSCRALSNATSFAMNANPFVPVPSPSPSHYVLREPARLSSSSRTPLHCLGSNMRKDGIHPSIHKFLILTTQFSALRSLRSVAFMVRRGLALCVSYLTKHAHYLLPRFLLFHPVLAYFYKCCR